MFLKKLLKDYFIKAKQKELFNKKEKKLGFMVKTALFFIFLYQSILSLWMGGCCRFYPSCSHYAEIAYKNYSFFKASSFVFKRLLNCHPLGPRWRSEPEIQPFLVKK